MSRLWTGSSLETSPSDPRVSLTGSHLVPCHLPLLTPHQSSLYHLSGNLSEDRGAPRLVATAVAMAQESMFFLSVFLFNFYIGVDDI